MIEGFVLPEMLVCPAKHEVCLARDVAFCSKGNSFQGRQKREQDMHVIRHNYIAVHGAKPLFSTPFGAAPTNAANCGCFNQTGPNA